MDYVVENWFDYEVNGKVPLSLLEVKLDEEINSFNKILEAINICNESSIVVLEVDESKIKEKILAVIKKFKEWIKGIKQFLKDKWDQLNRKIKESTTLNKIKKMEKVDVDFEIMQISVLIDKGYESENKTDFLHNFKSFDFPYDPYQIGEITYITQKSSPMTGSEYVNLVSDELKKMDDLYDTCNREIQYSEEKIIKFENDIAKNNADIETLLKSNISTSKDAIKDKEDDTRTCSRLVNEYRVKISFCKEISILIMREKERLAKQCEKIANTSKDASSDKG